MRLVVDANILVGELLRTRGLPLFSQPLLELTITQRAESEARHEVARRLTALVRSRRVSAEQRETLPAQLDRVLTLAILPMPTVLFAGYERKARRRMPRDPDDWPTVLVPGRSA